MISCLSESVTHPVPTIETLMQQVMQLSEQVTALVSVASGLRETGRSHSSETLMCKPFSENLDLTPELPGFPTAPPSFCDGFSQGDLCGGPAERQGPGMGTSPELLPTTRRDYLWGAGGAAKEHFCPLKLHHWLFIQQGGRSVANYSVKFWTLAAEVGWSELSFVGATHPWDAVAFWGRPDSIHKPQLHSHQAGQPLQGAVFGPNRCLAPQGSWQPLQVGNRTGCFSPVPPNHQCQKSEWAPLHWLANEHAPCNTSPLRILLPGTLWWGYTSLPLPMDSGADDNFIYACCALER